MKGNYQIEELITTHERLVSTIAKQYQNQGLPMPQLIQAGKMGLIIAARKFDETKGGAFDNYAHWFVRQYILAALSDKQHEGVEDYDLTEEEIFALQRTIVEAATQMGKSIRRIKDIRERALLKQSLKNQNL